MKLRMQKFKNVVPLLIQNFKDRKNVLVHTFEEIMSFLGTDYVIQRNKCSKGQNSRTSEFQRGVGDQDPLDTPTLIHKLSPCVWIR
jgi:hypothetical protein